MRFKSVSLATAAAALAFAPVAASAQNVDRATEVASDESNLGGSSMILAILAAAAVITGIIIAVDGDDDDDLPVSV